MWANVDLITGFVVGAYSKMSYFSRNNDCFANALGLGQTFVSYHATADQPFPSKIMEKAFWYGNLLVSYYSVYSFVEVCTSQLYDEGQTNWYASRYNTMLKESPTVGSPITFTTYTRVVNWVKVGFYVYSLLKYWKSKYYFYEKGFYMGAVLS